ncbi:hypothetical protein D3C87_2000940 [compost metagenome]
MGSAASAIRNAMPNVISQIPMGLGVSRTTVSAAKTEPLKANNSATAQQRMFT